MIGVAETGSGKTLAYLLPMFRHIMAQRPVEEGEGPIGLILVPTRELALQIHTESKSFAKSIKQRVCCVIGGHDVGSQIGELKRGVEIIVCTPGRMIDVLTQNSGKITNLKRVSYLVLDEADRMLDMGFGAQIERIYNNCRKDRQTVMFSATFPKAVFGIAKKYLVTPVEVVVGN